MTAVDPDVSFLVDALEPQEVLGPRFDIPGADAFLHAHMEHQSFADCEERSVREAGDEAQQVVAVTAAGRSTL